MTKTDMLAARIGGDHVADLDLLVGDDDPIDQELHQFTFLLEGGASKSTAHPLAETFHATDHAGKLHSLLRLRPQLPLLARERLVPLLQIPASSLVLCQRDHLPEVRLGQPLKLTPQGGAAFAEVLLARALSSCGSQWPPYARRSASVMLSRWFRTSHRSSQTSSSSWSAGA
jgi:hypothetical protein